MPQEPLPCRPATLLSEVVHGFVRQELERARGNQNPVQEQAVIRFSHEVRRLINERLTEAGGTFPNPACLNEVQNAILALPEVKNLPGSREGLAQAILWARPRILGILSNEIAVGPVAEFNLEPTLSDETGADRDEALMEGYLSRGQREQAQKAALSAIAKTLSADLLIRIGEKMTSEDPETASAAYRKALLRLPYREDASRLCGDLWEVAHRLFDLGDRDGARQGYLLTVEEVREARHLIILGDFFRGEYQDPLQAIALYGKALDKNPTFKEIAIILGKAKEIEESDSSATPLAVICLKRMLEDEDLEPEAYLIIARDLEKRDSPEADRAYAKYLERETEPSRDLSDFIREAAFNGKTERMCLGIEKWMGLCVESWNWEELVSFFRSMIRMNEGAEGFESRLIQTVLNRLEDPGVLNVVAEAAGVEVITVPLAIAAYRKAAQMTWDDYEALIDCRDAIEALNPEAPEANEIHRHVLTVSRSEPQGSFPAPQISNPHRTALIEPREEYAVLEGAVVPGTEGIKTVKSIGVRRRAPDEQWNSGSVNYNQGNRTFSAFLSQPGVYEVVILYDTQEGDRLGDLVVVRVKKETDVPKVSRPYLMTESPFVLPPGQPEGMIEVRFDTRVAMTPAEHAEISRNGGETWEAWLDFRPRVPRQWVPVSAGEKIQVRALDFERDPSQPSNIVEVEAQPLPLAAPAPMASDPGFSGEHPAGLDSEATRVTSMNAIVAAHRLAERGVLPVRFSVPEVLNSHELVLNPGMPGLVIAGRVENFLSGQQVVYRFGEGAETYPVPTQADGTFALPVSCAGTYIFSLTGQNTHTDIKLPIQVKDQRPEEARIPPAPQIRQGQELRADDQLQGFIPFYTPGQKLLYINYGATKPQWAELSPQAIDINGNFSLRLTTDPGIYQLLVRGIDNKDSQLVQVSVDPSAAELGFEQTRGVIEAYAARRPRDSVDDLPHLALLEEDGSVTKPGLIRDLWARAKRRIGVRDLEALAEDLAREDGAGIREEKEDEKEDK